MSTGTLKYKYVAQMSISYRTCISLTPAVELAALPGDNESLLPLPAITMREESHSVTALARVAKSHQEIKSLVGSAYGDKTLSISLNKFKL
jgi:hypothetical protein